MAMPRQPEEPHDQTNEDLTLRQRIAAEQEKPDFSERMQEQRQRPDFIENSKPEDPSDRPGQLTRDNVNPDIPSAPGIVDPNTLGMDQSQQGVAPPPAQDQPEQWPTIDERTQVAELPPGELPRTHSINEPPGSNVLGNVPEMPPAVPEGTAKPEATAQHEQHAEGEADPDDLEEEIEGAEDDGDVTTKHRGKPSGRRKK
jgi:hypothetical protein